MLAWESESSPCAPQGLWTSNQLHAVTKTDRFKGLELCLAGQARFPEEVPSKFGVESCIMGSVTGDKAGERPPRPRGQHVQRPGGGNQKTLCWLHVAQMRLRGRSWAPSRKALGLS